MIAIFLKKAETGNTWSHITEKEKNKRESITKT